MSLQVLAFDFGESRIGIATGNTLVKIAHPLMTVSGQNKFIKLEKIKDLVDKWKPSLLVIGLPTSILPQELSLDKATLLTLNRLGIFIRSTKEIHHLLQKIYKFANRLRASFNLPIEFVNEDYTSHTACLQLNEQNIRARAQAYKIDALAACEILNSYFYCVESR